MELRNAIKQVRPHMNSPSEIGALRRHLGSIGMFSATSGLLPAVQTQLKPLSGYEWRQQVRLAIATSDHHYASELAGIENFSLGEETSLLFDYLSLWLNEVPTGDFEFHACGPGPLGRVDSSIDLNQLPTARIIMPTINPGGAVDDIDTETKLIGYANGMTTSWLKSLEIRDRQTALSGYEFVRVKRYETWMSDDSRFEECVKISPLYLCGNPNMMPILILDLITNFRSKVFVTGTSFFLGAKPYRDSMRRYFSERNKMSDEHGSTGRVFERSQAIAGHDQIINRSILRNLLRSGWLSGDSLFVQALDIEDSKYLEALDSHYGGHRR